MKSRIISRRNFVRNAAVTSGIASLAPLNALAGFQDVKEKNEREVWIAGVSQMNLQARTSNEMVDTIIEILEAAKPYSPDFVCLPEGFPFAAVERSYSPSERVEVSEKVLKRFAEYSQKNKCYTICPVYTARDGKIFNSAVVFDRDGIRIGIYEKMHLTDYEIEGGYTCGQLYQPSIQTEFGPIGIQICFDMEWDDGWTMFRKQGSRIIFWPSAFAGGKCVSTKAWEHKCVISSATIKNTARLCDISGEVISQTGIWNPNLYCNSVNLEKAFLHTWPAVLRFGDISKKYGKKIRITNYHEEEWSVIESLDPEIFVKDILREFDLKTHEELTNNAEMLQKISRG
jgi:beta-ureidopropionase